MPRFTDQIVICTGAGQGIGRATARRFASEGAHVVAVDLSEETALATSRSIREDGGHATSRGVDVADRAAVQNLVAEVESRLGQIDILVNNAGILRDARLEKMTPEEFDVVIDVNLRGVFQCTQAVVPGMVKRGRGVILSASSVVARSGNFGQTNYVAAKAGVEGMTRVWARELGPQGIRVNAVAPGFIETAMVQGIPEKVARAMLSRVPLGRLGQPEEVASVYAWLASEDARYVHGQVIGVDGGAAI